MRASLELAHGRLRHEQTIWSGEELLRVTFCGDEQLKQALVFAEARIIGATLGFDRLQLLRNFALHTAFGIEAAQLGEVGADFSFEGGEAADILGQVTVGHGDGALQLGHHACGALLTNFLHALFELFAEGGNEHAGSISIRITDREIEDLGFAEFGAAGRTHIDSGAKGLYVVRSGRHADFAKRLLHDALALSELQNRFLQGFHFGQIGEFAEVFFGNAGRFGADDQCLCRLPLARARRGCRGRRQRHRRLPESPTSERACAAGGQNRPGCKAAPENDCGEDS